MNQKKTETELIQAVIKHFGIEAVLDCIPKEKILDRVDADDCVRHFGSVDIAYSLYYSRDKDQLLDLYTFSELALAAADKGDLKKWVETQQVAADDPVSQDEAISPLIRDALYYISPNRVHWSKEDAITALSEHINFWWR